MTVDSFLPVPYRQDLPVPRALSPVDRSTYEIPNLCRIISEIQQYPRGGQSLSYRGDGGACSVEAYSVENPNQKGTLIDIIA